MSKSRPTKEAIVLFELANIATLFETKLTGAIGIIKELKKQKILSDDDLRQITIRVRESGFYLSKKLLKDLDEI